MHLTSWYAKRAGGRMTVYGTATDEGRKIVGVDMIRPSGPGHCTAFDKNGDTHTLAV